ncbi:MAG: precorrin-6y C5,15-methyltransferase (decarboxylating) subunit CbiE, partial [Anaerovorax sp.]
MKKVYIIGIGMGNKETLTLQAKKAIEGCTVLAGAERMVNSFLKEGQRARYAIMPEALISVIEEERATDIGILMSGDLGFFSGAKKLRLLLEENYGSQRGNRAVQVVYLPGISTLSYFACALGLSWEDAKIISLHGREGELVRGALSADKTFFLADSGENTPGAICKELTQWGLGEAKVFVGERLSY